MSEHLVIFWHCFKTTVVLHNGTIYYITLSLSIYFAELRTINNTFKTDKNNNLLSHDFEIEIDIVKIDRFIVQPFLL